MIYIGIDIAKFKHFASVVSSDGEVILKPFSFQNSRDGFMKLLKEIKGFQDCLIGLESTGHYAEIIDNKINLIVKRINSGYIIGNYVVVSEKELFNKKESGVAYKSNFKMGSKIRDINKLNVGDYVVHVVHGIGIYRGIKTLTKNGLKKDYLTIEYKGEDKLYIPVEKLEFINKYSSNEGAVPKINKLGGTEWTKTKLHIKKKIESIAGDLLKLYSEREMAIGYAFDKDTEEQLKYFEKAANTSLLGVSFLKISSYLSFMYIISYVIDNAILTYLHYITYNIISHYVKYFN